MTYPLNGIAPLSHLGVIRVEGEDAAKFLHGQLTQDFALLDLQHARLAAFLSAKGRMQASFIGFKRSETEVLLVCSRDLLAPTLKRLSMFVMRAKARLSDATADYALYGVAGEAINSVAGGAQPAWTKADFGLSTVVHLYPALGQPRALWVAPAAEPAPAGPEVGHPSGEPARQLRGAVVERRVDAELLEQPDETGRARARRVEKGQHGVLHWMANISRTILGRAQAET